MDRIVVAGAGYAGLVTAGRIARRMPPGTADITVVNPVPHFVERVRNHQRAVGQRIVDRQLSDLLAGTGVRLRIGAVTELDPDGSAVLLADGGRLRYDTYVHAVGSGAGQQLPGAVEHGFHVATEAAALRLRTALAAHRPGDGPVTVIGGGMTGIEVATEIAESRPDLAVVAVTDDRLGGWLTDRAAAHLRRAYDRLGIEVVEGARVSEAGADRLVLADGSTRSTGLTVWTAGFSVSPLATDSALATTDSGLVRVDRTFRSVSHPDVYAVGDVAHAIGPGGRVLRMSCASGVPGGWQAGDAIAARLTGRPVPRVPVRYFQHNISLGRRDGIIQFVRADDSVRSMVLTGRKAVRYKEIVTRGALWGMTHPVPYPVRRWRPGRSAGTAGVLLGADAGR